MPSFFIPGQMPSLNEYLSACNKNPRIGGSMKRKFKNIAVEAITYSRSMKGYKAKSPLIVHFVYFEPNRRRDKDNVDSMCRKCVFDALQECGVIENDGWKQIDNYTHDFYVVDVNPHIEVFLEETGYEM